jgi:general secretion pathway protein E
MNKAPLSEFLSVAKQEGMKTMEEDGLEKVAQGITTQEEIWRVTKE